MSINETPNSERYTIGLFGRRNAGKSTLINAVTGQSIALTSDVAGTTTDPVQKAMELLPIGPVLIIDTAGLDDTGELGEKRVKKSYEALRKCDLALLVCDSTSAGGAFTRFEESFAAELKQRGIPCIVILNKCGDADGISSAHRQAETVAADTGLTVVCADAVTGAGVPAVKDAIISAWSSRNAEDEAGLTDGLIDSGDLAVLVTPIDSAAPKGRLILPQQQVLRDILDRGAYAVVVRETELSAALRSLAEPPRVVITDSQAFKRVSEDVPKEIPLTSFSILFSRLKGDIGEQLNGIKALKALRAGDSVLISEGCTHHRQCGDIGTEKIPAMLNRICPGLKLSWTSGVEFPDDLTGFSLVIHCGGCMLNRKEMKYRIGHSVGQGVPVTNYGLLMAYCTGILNRAVEPLGYKL